MTQGIDEPEFISLKPGTSCIFLFFARGKKPFYKNLSLMKARQTLISCDGNSFLCECDMSGDNTFSLLCTSPKEPTEFMWLKKLTEIL